jgi:hypothetical protein
VTKGNGAKLAATALVALLIVLLSVRTMGYKGEQWSGGEGGSQSPLNDKAFSTFLGQKRPFELRRKLAFRLHSFHEIHRGLSNWTNLSISVGGGQQDWLAFALRRQRSHVRIVSGAPLRYRTLFEPMMRSSFALVGSAWRLSQLTSRDTLNTERRDLLGSNEAQSSHRQSLRTQDDRSPK